MKIISGFNYKQWDVILLYFMPFGFIMGRGIAEVILALLTLKYLITTPKQDIRNALNKPWWLISGIIWLYLIFQSLIITQGDPDTLRRSIGWIRFPLYALMLSEWFSKDRKMFNGFLWGLVAVVSFVAIDVCIQAIWGSDIFGNLQRVNGRLSGPFSDLVAGTYMHFLMFPAASVLFAWGMDRGGVRQYLWFLFLFIMIVAIALTGERSALFKSLIGFTFFVCLSAKSYYKIILGIVLLPIALFTVYSFVPHVQDRIDKISEHGYISNFWETPYGSIYSNSLKMISNQPVFGVGLRKYRNECQKEEYRIFNNAKKKICGLYPHHTYLEWWVETGGVGLGLFLLLLYILTKSTIQASVKMNRTDFIYVIGTASCMLSLFFPLLPSRSFFNNWNAIMIWLVIGIHVSLLKQRR